LTVDLNTGMVSSLIVSTGLVKTSGGPINVFNNAFTDGATDAIGIQGLSPTGNFGGIVPGGSSSVIVDLRGPNTVINDTAFPTDAGTLNAFPQRTLGLPAPSNPNAVTGVATIGPLSLVGSSTPGGAEVEVVLTPTLENGSTTNIALSFGTVTTEGTTSVSVSTEGPPPPGGVIISGQTVFYDIKTTAVTSGPVEICLSYDDSGLDPQAEQNLTLWHFEEPAVGDPFWVNITREGDPDTVNNIICGVTSSFSAFTIFQVNPDSDNDGLTDEDEIVWGTDPNNPDTDQDGLLDGTEVDIVQGTGCPNPLTVDSDGDGISDGEEVGAGTNPCNVDTDGDSIPDNIDPFPTVPEEDVAGFVEAWLRDLSNLVHSFDLSTIAAKNDNAARGRRNAMSNKLDSAANSIAVGDTAAAIDQLSSLFQKLDGEPSPGDWMGDSPQRNDLRNQIGLILGLLAG